MLTFSPVDSYLWPSRCARHTMICIFLSSLKIISTVIDYSQDNHVRDFCQLTISLSVSLSLLNHVSTWLPLSLSLALSLSLSLSHTLSLSLSLFLSLHVCLPMAVSMENSMAIIFPCLSVSLCCQCECSLLQSPCLPVGNGSALWALGESLCHM